MTSIYLRYPTDPVNNLPIGLDGFRRLDLFEDENIEFTSKVNDITKLDKVFSDFSNSFTVPATANNLEIFRYYYDVDLEVEYTYNPNIKIDCYVEIDTVPYRYATLQLESIKMKNNRADSCSISVFSSITQLTDLFGEDLISDLDKPHNSTEAPPNGLAMYDYENTSANYFLSIVDQSFQNGSIITPMINMSNKEWNLSGATTPISQNITTDAFLASDTRPSFAIIRIIEAIEKKYHVKFSRDFFGRAEFMNLFMWLNRKENLTFGQPVHIKITQPLVVTTGTATNITLNADGDIDMEFIDAWRAPLPEIVRNIASITYNITPQTGYEDVPYTVKIFDFITGDLLKEKYVSGGGTSSTNYVRLGRYTDFSAIKNFKFRLVIEAYANISVDVDVDVFTGTRTSPGTVGGTSFTTIQQQKVSNNNIVSTQAMFSISDNIPEMKVIEFMQNIMKMFKLIIRPLQYDPLNPEEKNGVFKITTLNSYYLNGDQRDLTEFIDFTEINIKKPDIYKELLWSYEPTKNILGQKYKEDNIEGIGYGDLKITFDDTQVNTKNKLEVKVGWENMLFERLENSSNIITNLMIGESITTDDHGVTIKKNRGKTVLFYNMGLFSLDNISPKVKVKYSSNDPDELPYVSIVGNSNDSLFPQVTQSINFHPGNTDPWHLEPIPQSLFETKWRKWVDEIYDFRQRKFAFKAVSLDPKTITGLDLADTVIIKDTIYKIDDMKINLSTGDATLNLFRTFRPAEIPTFFNPVIFGTPETRAGEPLIFSDYIEDGDNIIFYGNFTEVNGVSKNHLVKMDRYGAIIDEFNVGTGFAGWSFVEGGHKLLRVGNDLYICGSFTGYNGVSANNLVKLDYTTGAINTTFATNIGTGANNKIYAMADTGTGIVVGGAFTAFDGSTLLNRLTVLNYNGTGTFAFVGSINGDVTDILPIIGATGTDSYAVTGTFTSSGFGHTGIFNFVPPGSVGGISGEIHNVISNTPGAYIGLARAGETERSSAFWIYGDVASIGVSPAVSVNKMAFVNSEAPFGSGVVQATIPLGPIQGVITSARYLFQNKILVQGEASGFTTFADMPTRSVIINTAGNIEKTFPGTDTFVYNIGNDLYKVDLGESKGTGPTSGLTTLNRTAITATAGQMFYGVQIQQKIPWIVEKIDTGYGTDWIKFISNKFSQYDLDTTTGLGYDECTFVIKNKANQTPPALFAPRTMRLKFTFGDGTTSVVDILQTGLVDF